MGSMFEPKVKSFQCSVFFRHSIRESGFLGQWVRYLDAIIKRIPAALL